MVSYFLKGKITLDKPKTTMTQDNIIQKARMTIFKEW
jgi:hypothetical protein